MFFSPSALFHLLAPHQSHVSIALLGVQVSGKYVWQVGRGKKKKKHIVTKTLHPQSPGCISELASPTGPPSKSPFLWEEESIPNTEEIQPKAASELSQAAQGTDVLIHSGVHTRTLTLGTVVRVTKLLCRCKGREFPATSAEIQTGMLPLCHKKTKLFHFVF